MGTCSLTLSGQIVVGGPGCGCSGSDLSQKLVGLGFACSGQIYQAIGGTDCAVPIATPGAAGDSFIELPNVSSIGGFQLLALKSSAKVVLRIGADVAELLGSGGTFPTLFSGGETFAFKVDASTVTVTFTAGAQTAQQVINQINASAMLLGVTFLPAFLQSNGQVGLRGVRTGPDGLVDITVANATVGFASAAAEAAGAGADVLVNGLTLMQFDPSSPPERIQISGSAQIEVLAAGLAA